MPFQIGFSHTLWRKPTLAIGGRFLHKAPRDNKLSSTKSQHFRALSSATIGSLRCSSHSSNRVSFSSQDVVFAIWIIEILSTVLGCFHFQKGFRFLGFMWLLSPRCPAHFFVAIAEFLPVFSFNTFVDRLASGVPISVYQGRAPPLLCNVIDTDTRLLECPLLPL